jgi:dipeptidyl aminopeptidase/acylaminoacyl peptidase
MRHEFAQYLNIRSAISPVLMPEGGRVAFLSDITGNFQVWSAATRGDAGPRWPRQLTFLPDKVWELHGTAAARQLIAVSDAGGNERHQLYLVSNYGVDERGREAHSVTRLTHNDDAIHEFGAFSHDGREILYTCNERNGIAFDIYRLNLHTGERRLLAETAGPRRVAAWSPDGGQALSLEEVGADEVDIYLLDLETGAERRLTEGRAPARYDGVHWTAGGVVLIGNGTHDRGAVCRLDPATGEVTALVDADAGPGRAASGEMELLAVARDGRHAAFTLNVDGYSRLYLLDLRTLRCDPVSELPEGVVGSLKFDARGTFLLLDVQAPAAPGDVYSVRVVDGSCRQLTFSNRAGVDAAGFVNPELVCYPTFDGRQIPAFHFRPRQPPPEGGYPCILYVHGGPASQLRPTFFPSFQYFLEQGYAILAPNVRGSAGYGRAFRALDDVELRLDSVRDLEAAAQWLRAQPDINASRIAIYGRSYGGFMVLAAMTEYPGLFAAGVDVVGIANWVTFLERTGAWRRANREREYGSLERDREFLERISPLHKAERIRVPLLVMAGDNDPRVPLYESEQVVKRVRGAGGTVHFVHYADEGHIFSKLENRIDSFTQIAEFLDRNL